MINHKLPVKVVFETKITFCRLLHVIEVELTIVRKIIWTMLDPQIFKVYRNFDRVSLNEDILGPRSFWGLKIFFKNMKGGRSCH
jgi:hypothetical protein